MKILIVSDLHYPTINGISTFSRNLAIGLADHGHEVVVVAPSQTGKKYKEVDGNHVIVRTASVPFMPYQNFRISPTPGREVKKVIQDFQPDVIHIQVMMWLGQAAMRYSHKFNIPIVATNHSMPQNSLDNIRLLAPLSRPIEYMLEQYGARFHSKADYVTLPTQSAIDMFRASDKVEAPMEAVSNGIDLTRFQPGKPPKALYKRYNLPTDRPIITYVGRLDAEKHLPVLIDAFKKVLKKVDAHLLVVGDGSEAISLKEMAHELEIFSSISFTGRVSEEDKALLHQVGTVFAMPSPMELQSIATLEAMASGQPIVAVDAGALGELCQDKRNGYLVSQDDSTAFAKALLKILHDPTLRDRFGKESLEIAKTHDLQTTLKRFEEIYAQVIKSRSKRATSSGVS